MTVLLTGRQIAWKRSRFCASQHQDCDAGTRSFQVSTHVRNGGTGGAETNRSPRCPHNCYFDSVSGVLLPRLLINLSVSELT